MTVRVNKPEFNLREKLSELERPIGLKGSELMRAETTQEARDLVSAGRKNIIINGAMRVAQRGTTGSGTGYKSVDRIHMATSTSNVTFSQGSITSGEPYSKGFRNYGRMTNTSASTASGNYREIDYKFEARDLANSGWVINDGGSHATFSAWVRSSVSQKFFMYIRSIGGTTKSYTFGFETIANTWVKIEHTIPGDSTLGVNNDNSLGMLIRFIVDYGANFTGSSCTENVWRVTGVDYTPDSDGTWAATTGATFDITGLQLEVGKNATEFEHRPYGEELALCQRYYYNPMMDGYVMYPIRYLISTGNNGWTNWPVSFPTAMRIIPSLVSDLSDSNNTSGPPTDDQWAFYWQNQGYVSKTGNSDMSVLNIAASATHANVGAYYVSPTNTNAASIKIGANRTFAFNAEL